MRKYKKPAFVVVTFSAEDVLISSGVGGDTKITLPPDDNM